MIATRLVALVLLLAAAPARPNHLSGEHSLYLRQHATNPVDWYPWGQAAFDRARREDKPIFLSIGYSTCHWCHVMERESFTDAQVAKALNDGFVAIKVDREEHPDVDAIYMSALQATGEGGGWPLNMFLTPDLKPFHGGTYFPKEALLKTLASIREGYAHDRKKIGEVTAGLVAALRTYTTQAEPGKLDLGFTSRFVAAKAESFDPAFGGFGGAPKFPAPMALRVMLRHHVATGDARALAMAEKTLEEMARGGMYDQLAGGFHRYATDRQWLVPHFEKMLYDNALLAMAYVEAWQATGKAKYARTAREIFDYVLRDMRDPGGAFHSATDADSEGVEGKFFTWTPEQVAQVLGSDAARFCEIYDVTAGGNFERKQSILHLPRSLEEWAVKLKEPEDALRVRLDAQREKLRLAREARVHPARDEKVISAWSALMTSALALGAQAFGEPRYRKAAVEAGTFLFTRMMEGDAVFRRSAEGQREYAGTLEDYAYLVNAAVDLYELTFDPAWLERALALTASTDRRFRDPKGGYVLAEARADLLVPVKVAMDDALPSPVSMMVLAKARLAELTGRADLRAAAQADADAFAGMTERFPTAFAQLALGMYMLRGDPFEIVLSGDLDSKDGEALVRAVHARLLPARVLARAGGPDAARTAKLVPLVEGRAAARPTAYVCRQRACKLPATDAAALADQLRVRPK